MSTTLQADYTNDAEYLARIEAFKKHLEFATRYVASWTPEKRAACDLIAAASPTVSVPRKPIFSPDNELSW